ncbi:hypothetical protein RDn1_020 [Candidatus Termititenax dinenymphae]|uniref:GerMN domain-containing protein n=1 Tax=Candidatus Termititenax dinenymphae TaxID=2218523 RepID=A0A388TKB9_9BACT|nr:hypothetical protein RDn1_020 [Candidatus Termititenax dinenymphae]
MKKLLLVLVVGIAVIFAFLGLEHLQNSTDITIYFYRSEQLYPVRQARLNDLPPLEATLTALFNGPTTAEKSLRLQTLIPENIRPLNYSINGEVLTLVFAEDFLLLSGGHHVIDGMLQQIVFTVTEIKGIKSVRFQIENSRSNTLIIGGEGYTIDRPLSRVDFTGAY